MARKSVDTPMTEIVSTGDWVVAVEPLTIRTHDHQETYEARNPDSCGARSQSPPYVQLLIFDGYSATCFQSPRTMDARISFAFMPIRDIRSANSTSFRQTVQPAE